jgi:BetI-type transcriptional repressor, C-terminal
MILLRRPRRETAMLPFRPAVARMAPGPPRPDGCAPPAGARNRGSCSPFVAQAAVVPELAAAADDAAQRLQEPLTARIAHATQAGELPARLDPGHEAIRLQLLIYGPMVELATTTTPPRRLARWAQAILDEHLAAVAAAPGTGAQRHPPRPPAAADRHARRR